MFLFLFPVPVRIPPPLLVQVVEPKVLHRSGRFRSDSSKRRTTRRRKMHRELIWIYKMIYLHSDLHAGPARTHHIHHNIHDTFICQIFDSQNVDFVKSSTLLRLKTRFFSQWNPGKFDPKFQETRSPMRYNISRGRLISVPCSCSLFLFPVPIRHHWENKLIPVLVPWILTGKPFAGKPSFVRSHTFYF